MKTLLKKDEKSECGIPGDVRLGWGELHNLPGVIFVPAKTSVSVMDKQVDPGNPDAYVWPPQVSCERRGEKQYRD